MLRVKTQGKLSDCFQIDNLKTIFQVEKERTDMAEEIVFLEVHQVLLRLDTWLLTPCNVER